MPIAEFLFLLAGMLDTVNPTLTEPQPEKVSRLTREAHQQAVQQAGPKKGWG